MASNAMAATSSQGALRSLTRTFAREQRQSTILPKRTSAARRNDPISLYVGRMVRDESKATETYAPKRLENITMLLTHGRIHAQLLARYNPTYGKSEQERIKATANRVGLDVPKEYEDAARNALENHPSIDQKYRSN